MLVCPARAVGACSAGSWKKLSGRTEPTVRLAQLCTSPGKPLEQGPGGLLRPSYNQPHSHFFLSL